MKCSGQLKKWTTRMKSASGRGGYSLFASTAVDLPVVVESPSVFSFCKSWVDVTARGALSSWGQRGPRPSLPDMWISERGIFMVKGSQSSELMSSHPLLEYVT